MIAPSDYTRIARAIEWLDANAAQHPSLGDAATAAGLSGPHFQRLFTRWAGISPKRFLQARTAEAAARLLRDGRPALDAAYTAGLSGPSRLHELVVHAEAATPGELKARGAGLTIRYGWHATPFGDALFAATPRGLCFLAFAHTGGRAAAFDDLRSRWPEAPGSSATTRARPSSRHVRSRSPSGAAVRSRFTSTEPTSSCAFGTRSFAFPRAPRRPTPRSRATSVHHEHRAQSATRSARILFRGSFRATAYSAATADSAATRGGRSGRESCWRGKGCNDKRGTDNGKRQTASQLRPFSVFSYPFPVSQLYAAYARLTILRAPRLSARCTARAYRMKFSPAHVCRAKNSIGSASPFN